MVVAIDGPSGVGKSTVAAAVAAALGIPHLDTGSHYRAATLIALEAGADPGDEEAVLAALAAADLDPVPGGGVNVDGRPVGDRLRAPDVTAAVSVVAAHPGVREALVRLQRRWVEGRGGSAVVEGRDIGTVVFPAAPVKVFLTASVAVRARRRAGDPEVAGLGLEALAAQIERRDRIDSTRAVAPLRPADDAVVIDTSDLDVPGVVRRILDLVGSV